jgi:predicted Zn finger-like uncharacterized protein
MNIACASCPAKYAVPDDKVRGRKVRITCKRCGAAIIVDGTSLAAAALPGTAERPAQQTIAGGTEAPADHAPPPAADGVAASAKAPATAAADGAAPDSAEKEKAPAPAAAAKAAVKPFSAALGGAKPLASVAKQGGAPDAKAAFPKSGAAGAKIGGLGKAASAATSAATASAGAATTGAARAVGVPRATAAARAVAPSALPERTWTVAVTDDDHREMTLTQLVDAYAAETIDSETFVWRDGMQDWLMPFEIAEIAGALRTRRLSPRTNAAALSSPSDARPFGEEPAGTWREPGRWDRTDPAPDEPNFDDVTVAMEAPKARALLQAVTGEDVAPIVPAASKHDELTALVAAPAAVTPELLGFGLDDDQAALKAAPESAAAEAPAEAERRPDKLPFELAPSATPGRAAIKASNEGAAEPRDLFARGASRDDQPQDVAAAKADWDPKEDAVPEPGAAAPALTGARNESSVLFSLDQLTKTEAKTAPSPTKKKREEAALLLGGSTGAAPEIAPAAGGLFGQTNMAAPDFTAPPPPSVPPPAQRAVSSSAPEAAAPKSGGAGKWIGLVLGLAVVGGGAFFLARSPAPPPATPPAPSATAVPATATPVSTPTPEATATASATPTAAESPSGVASAPTAGSAAPVAGSAAAVPGAAPTAATARPQATAAPKPSAATETAPAEGPDFDKDAASAALASAAAQAESQCGAEQGPHGTGKVSVTFVNSGRATNALVSGDFAGSALGGCVARIFRGAKVPAFGGESVRVSKTVRIP